jgi:hypothetical protein
VTFGDDKKGKVLGTFIIKVNDHFTMNAVALVDKLRYNIFSVSQLVSVDFDVFFTNSILVFSILLAILFVAFLA